MKTKLRLVRPPPPQSNSWLKPWLGCLMLLAIAFNSSKFILFIDLDLAYVTGLLGIALGAISENYFSVAVLFVEGSIAVMAVILIIALFTLSLSTSLFELICTLLAVIILAMVTAIIAQWLIKDWIYPFWGKFRGTVISAIAIAIGILWEYLLARYLI